MIAGAVEVFEDYSDPTLKSFVEDATVRGTRTAADGGAGYNGTENHKLVAVGAGPAHEVLDWIYRVFANLKHWGLGVGC